MAQQTINVGAAPNDGTGTPLRTAFQYTNSNFTELYTALGGGSGLPGASGQLIFNNGTSLAGDNELFYNATTNTLTTEKLIVPGNTQVAGSASNLYVGSILNPTLFVNTNTNRVGVLNAAPNDTFTIASDNYLSFQTASTGFNSGRAARIGAISAGSGNGYLVFETYQGGSGGAERYRIASDGVATWSNVGGSSGTAMTLNSTGLGIGASPSDKLSVNGGASFSGFGINANPLNPVSTSQRQARFQNTGGDFYFGIESSSAGGFFPGSTAYATCFYNATATPLQFFTNGSLKATIDTSGNVLVGTTSGTFRGTFVVAGGANRDILAAGVTAVSDGFQVKWDHATTKINVIISNMPTSSAGLAAGTLWNDAGTIKIA